jgi:hypothetical protein
MATRTSIVYGTESEAKDTQTLAVATTLTASDSGKVITLSASAGKVITLPSVAIDGFNLKVIVGAAFATTNFTIVAPTNKIQGGAIVNSVFVPASDENTISFVASAESIGDYVEIVSDGTNFYVNGVGALAGSITFTAV